MLERSYGRHGGSKFERDLSNRLKGKFREATNATEKNVSIIRLKWKDALKRVSTHIESKAQTASSRIRTELERNDSKEL